MHLRARSSSPSGAGPIGSRHSPTGMPERPQHRLGRDGIRCSVAGLEVVGLDQRRVDLPRTLATSPFSNAAIISPMLAVARPVRATPMTPTAPDREQRQGERVVAAVELEVRRVPRRSGGRSRPDRPRRPSPPTMFGTSRPRRRRTSVSSLASGADRDVVDASPAATSRPRLPEVRFDARPATVGCSTASRRAHRRRPAGRPRRVELDGVARVVGTAAGDHRHVDGLAHRPPDLELLVVGRAGASPVVPVTTSPSLPCSTSQRARCGGALEVELARWRRTA